MKKDEHRKRRLLAMLSTQKRLTIGSVIRELDISEATARRLFIDLEKTNKLIRIHGGVQEAPEAAPDYSFRFSSSRHTREKTAIGFEAARQVRSRDRIYLDSGTTVLKMADALALRLQLGEIERITVLTNSVSVMERLADLAEIIMAGGVYRSSRRDVCGPLTEKYLSAYCFDKAFLGVDAIAPSGHLLTTDDRTAIMNETVIRNSSTVFILADASKFDNNAFVAYAKLDTLKATVITDPSLPAGQKKWLTRRNIKVITATHKSTGTQEDLS